MEEKIQLSQKNLDININPHQALSHYDLKKIKVTNGITFCKLYCLQTHVILNLSIQEIVFNSAILQGLSSRHSCFIGFEYAKILRPTLKNNSRHKNLLQHAFLKKDLNTQISYHLYSQTRDNRMIFMKEDCNAPITMDPIEMLQWPLLVEQFDSMDAFYIGLYAGLKLARMCVH